MSDRFQVPPPAADPVALPPIVWVGGHPTIADPETRGTRLRRCIRCNARGEFHSLSCEPGMVVHLIDPADVHDEPQLFDGVAWAEPESIAGAHRHWTDKGFKVVRRPYTAAGESKHPRYAPCPQCNEEAMAAGTLTPLHLPTPEPQPRSRGRAAR